MIPLEKFLNCVQQNAERVTHYENGGDGSGGGCDCIGLIIGAVELAGGKWPGIHGSNWAARNAMEALERIAGPGKMFLGEIVYKAKEPGEDGYSLPDRYKDSGDLRDYYHVGVVTGIDPLEITHCTSVAGGIKVDDKRGAWAWGGKLKYVDYSEDWEDEPMEVKWATVTAENGRTVNMRKEPDKKSTIIARVPVGDQVEILETHVYWDKVSYGGKDGYMMTEFLREDSDAHGEEADTVTVPRDMLETWADVLEEMARDIRESLGQG